MFITDNEGIPLGNRQTATSHVFDRACQSTQPGSRTYLPITPKWSDVIPSHLFRDRNPQRNSSKTSRGHYFQAGTGTRYWIGVKVFKNDPPGVKRWWAGHALRDRDPQTNMFLDSYTFQTWSMRTDFHRKGISTSPSLAYSSSSTLQPYSTPSPFCRVMRLKLSGTSNNFDK